MCILSASWNAFSCRLIIMLFVIFLFSLFLTIFACLTLIFPSIQLLYYNYPWLMVFIAQSVILICLSRLQRTNKEGTSGSGLRYSPVHADHSVLAPAPVHVRSHAFQHANGKNSSRHRLYMMTQGALALRPESIVAGLNKNHKLK